MAIYNILLVLVIFGAKASSLPNHGFVYDASAHLSATYFNGIR